MKLLNFSHLVLPLLPLFTQAWVLSAPTQNCSSLANTAASLFPSRDTTIVNSTLVPKGSIEISNVTNALSFCQVSGQVIYKGNNTLNFELWMPNVLAYEGRFMAVGGGGMAGVIDKPNMILQLNKGFAVAGGDSGHLASLNNNGEGAPNVYLPYLHNRDQVEAWIHNAISIFTPAAKSLVSFFYGKAPSYSYYDGCSTGGAQGFALAQFHPKLFDGIVAGSPGNWYSHLALSFLWNGLKTQNASSLPQPILNHITSAVLDQCDTIDGVADRVIENPLLCDFDISTLQCNSTSTSGSTCLTAAQVEAARAIYSGPVSTLPSKAQLYPGFDLGSEIQWLLQEKTLFNAFSVPILQNLVYDNLKYDYHNFNFGSDIADVDAKAGAFIDEISTDLTQFRSHGAKLLVTQGWADPFNAATWPIQHMQNIQAFFVAHPAYKSSDISDFFNLFMIPGGGHCGSASYYPEVPATYHTIDKMVAWVERGEKPDWILSTNPPSGKNTSRLLCPWPATASLVEGGDSSWWGSYVCE